VFWLLFRGYVALATGSADDVYKILLTLAGAVGAPFVAWRTLVAHQQTGIARETHYTTLFTRAVEQLGATREVKAVTVHQGGFVPETRTEPNLEVRLGAIYALERIAQDSERDHWPIMEVLCAYLRNPQNTGSAWGQQEEEPDDFWRDRIHKDIPDARVDVQAALTVIGRRRPERIAHERRNGLALDLSGANLQRAAFSGDFRHVSFREANLAGAALRGIRFVAEELQNVANLDGTTFTDCDLSRHTIWAVRRIVGTQMFHCVLKNLSLQGVSLNDVHMTGCDLTGASFRDCRIHRSHLEVNNFFSADFSNSFVIDSTLGYLTNAALFGADLSRVSKPEFLNIADTFGDGTTKLPESIERPQSWPDGVHSVKEWRAYVMARPK
jgi:hypothetical protein